MSSYVNTDGFQENRYFARSWALLTQEPGWLKKVFLLALASWVPIIGLLGVQGYLAEWARLVAWGASVSPSRSGGSVGGYIKSGFRAFVVTFVWGLLWGLLVTVILIVPVVNALFGVVLPLISFVLALIINIAVIRATIYQSVEAGFKFSTIGTMAERDAGGLLRILAIQVLASILISIISSIVFIIVVLPFLGELTSSALELIALIDSDLLQPSDSYLLLYSLIALFVALLPALLVASFIASFFSMASALILFIALGLWMRQFNVPAWGGNDDPLPMSLPPYVPVQYTPYNPYATNAPQAQAPYAYGDTDYGMQTHGGVGNAQTGWQDGSQNQYPQS